MSVILVEAIGGVATAITTFQVGRQALDVSRSVTASGVSTSTWALAIVQSLGILVLSIDGGYAAAAVANGAVAAFCYLILVQLARKQSWTYVLAAGVAATALPLACALWSGPALAGALGAASSVIVWVPQAVRAVGTRRGAGLSKAFVTAGVASSALWLLYGFLVGEWRLLVPPTMALLSMVVTANYALGKASPGAAQGEEP